MSISTDDIRKIYIYIYIYICHLSSIMQSRAYCVFNLQSMSTRAQQSPASAFAKAHVKPHGHMIIYRDINVNHQRACRVLRHWGFDGERTEFKNECNHAQLHSNSAHLGSDHLAFQEPNFIRALS